MFSTFDVKMVNVVENAECFCSKQYLRVPHLSSSGTKSTNCGDTCEAKDRDDSCRYGDIRTVDSWRYGDAKTTLCCPRLRVCVATVSPGNNEVLLQVTQVSTNGRVLYVIITEYCKAFLWPLLTFTKPMQLLKKEFVSAFYVSTLSTNEKSSHRAAAGRKWKN